MSIGLAVMQKTAKGSLELVYVKEFSTERQTELDVELEPGEYVILPMTSGCHLRRPLSAKNENIKLIDSSGILNPLAEVCIKDIFRRLDKYMVNNILEYGEFEEFYNRIGIKITEADFR